MPSERRQPETSETARRLDQIADRLDRLRAQLDDRARVLAGRDEDEREAGGRPDRRTGRG